MNDNVAETDRSLEQLLSELASRIDGSLDYWTALCFLPEDQQFQLGDFIDENITIINSLVTQIERHLNERTTTCLAFVQDLFSQIARLAKSFLVISEHRKRPVEAVRFATVQLAEAYHLLIQTISNIAVLYGVELVYWRRRTLEREQYYHRILSGLFQLTQESRSSGTIPPSLQMGASEFEGVREGLQDAGLNSDDARSQETK